MSEHNQNTKVVVVTALISALSTIAVSFIGVLPMLDAKADTIDRPEAGGAAPRPEVPGESWKITGSVASEETAGDPLYAALHLMPLTGSRETVTDDEGKFSFDNVPPGAYCLLVKVFDPGNDNYVKLRLEQEASQSPLERPVAGTPVRYAVLKGNAS